MLRLILVLLALPSCVPEPAPADRRALERADEAFLLSDFARAHTLYRSHLAAHPAEPRRAEVLLRMAKCRLGEENWTEALRELEEAEASGPGETIRIEIVYRRAIALTALDRLPEARSAFRRVESEGARGSAVREDEFRYRFGVALLRAGDWSAGKAQLNLVPPGSPLADDAKIRLQLDRFAVQIARCSDAESARRAVEDAARKGVTARVLGGSAVVVGGFARFEDARDEARRLRERGFVGAFALP